ncbi:MAG TPA: ATP-binding protein [Lacunisphaera sp.]|nr:ATP-binding protein [Lacunisphaera sp.]
MKLHFRFLLLILSLFAVLLVGMWLHESTDASQTSRLRVNLLEERTALVDRLVELTGDPLRVFASDYSPWDEMMNFVSHPDPDWARVNLDAALTTHRIDAVWVLRPNCTEVHASVREGLTGLRAVPLDLVSLRNLFARDPAPHFFALTDTGLLEVRGAPIRPSDPAAKTPAPAGWLLAARHWDAAYLRQLEILLGGQVEIVAPGVPAGNADAITTDKSLPDWQGRPLRSLRTTVVPSALQRANEDARLDLVILCSFGVIALLAFSIATHAWVVRPLRRLEAGLAQRNTAPLGPLLKSSSEFGNLGRLVEQSFQQEEKLRQIYTAFNAIDDAVFITDTASGCITHANQGATRLLGVEAVTLVGQSLANLKGRPPAATEDGTWLRCADGRFVEVEAREQALPGNAAQKLTVTVARDISGRRREEKQRLRAQRLESLGTLAGGVAHDMNNMLTPVILMLDDLQETGHHPSPDMLATVRTSVRRGATMLRQLLTFGHGFEGERAPLDMEKVIEEISRIVASTFPKSITFETKVAHHLPAVLGDATQIHQVLLNLCVNARDALPAGGTISVSATHLRLDAIAASTWSDAKPGDYVQLDVADNGQGIPPAILDRIFDPFFTTKSADKGTGLGLSTSLGIIRGHGGSIRVYSVPNRGTRFTVLLPTAAAVPVATAPAHPEVFEGGGRTVLVVEDEDSIRDLLQRTLARMSLKVLPARNGIEGLELYQQHRSALSLVITDLHMPGLDGQSIMRAIRAASPQLPILVMSGRIDEPTLASLRTHGMTGLIDKPFGYDVVLAAVRRVLA